MLQRIKGWKTVIFARLLVVAGFLATILSAMDVVQITALLPDKFKPFAPMILCVIGVIVEVLRRVTDTAVGQSAPLDPGKA